MHLTVFSRRNDRHRFSHKIRVPSGTINNETCATCREFDMVFNFLLQNGRMLERMSACLKSIVGGSVSVLWFATFA